MSDIIIVDEEFKAVVEQIKTEGKETDEAVQKLIDVFTRITPSFIREIDFLFII